MTPTPRVPILFVLRGLESTGSRLGVRCSGGVPLTHSEGPLHPEGTLPFWLLYESVDWSCRR